jgi:hypothetical protein
MLFFRVLAILLNSTKHKTERRIILRSVL